MNAAHAALALLLALPQAALAAAHSADDAVLVIHGGISWDKKDSTPAIEESVRKGLKAALDAGYAVLKKKGTSLDAVEAAIRVMEDDPQFNAGKGAVFTDEGRNELDASIMDGKTKKAGAVASVTVVKNPITAARAVMEKTRHVMLIGRGAEVFATKAGLDIVDPSYFWTKEQWDELHKYWRDTAQKEKLKGALPAGPAKPHYGTVGALALDAEGNLAAGTSTGGLTGKRYGRVGDSPIIGAGTYADNASCAVSATGTGEYFIRFTVAHEISSLVKYKGLPLKEAASQVVNGTLKEAGGDGGVITLDPKGRFAAAYNTEGMYRAYMTKDGVAHIFIFE